MNRHRIIFQTIRRGAFKPRKCFRGVSNRPSLMPRRQQDELSSQFARSTISKPTFKERFGNYWREAKKDYPIMLPVLLIATIGSVALLGLVIYDDYTRVHPHFEAYPPTVELRLRQALYAVHAKPDPDHAELAFTEALRAADEAGMDPYSKPVIGIRLRLAEALEKFGRVKASIEVLRELTQMCEEKVADIDRGANVSEPTTAAAQRGEMIRSIIQCRVKIASLYESDYLQDSTSAKAILSDAISLLTKETKDPQTNGFNADNGAGLSLAEIASILSQMGDLYATTGEESNAVQVYMLTLQPLRLSCEGTRSCKEVQVLSNIASTMAIAMKKPGATINGKPADKTSLAAARRAILMWADQAIATAEVVKPEDRDEVCELGLISAQMTKADLLLEDGKTIQAREAWRSMLPGLREKRLDALVKVAEEGIRKAGGGG